MKAAKIITLIVAIVSGLTSLTVYLAPIITAKIFLSDISSAGAIGIIGGADGPTAIFVTRVTSPPRIIFPVIFVISALLWFFLRHKGNNIEISQVEDKK